MRSININVVGVTSDREELNEIENIVKVFVVTERIITLANDIKSEEDAIDKIAKTVGITQARDIRLERMSEILDKYLLPHLGTKKEDRIFKGAGG